MIQNKDHIHPIEKILWRSVSKENAERVKRNGLLEALNRYPGTYCVLERMCSVVHIRESAQRGKAD